MPIKTIKEEVRVTKFANKEYKKASGTRVLRPDLEMVCVANTPAIISCKRVQSNFKLLELVALFYTMLPVVSRIK